MVPLDLVCPGPAGWFLCFPSPVAAAGEGGSSPAAFSIVAFRLADRHAVLQAALGPQRVDAAGDLERAARADIALEDLAVIAGRLDDLDHPVVVEAEIGADLGFGLGAEQAADVGAGAFLHLV